jgi:hypothetical protein
LLLSILREEKFQGRRALNKKSMNREERRAERKLRKRRIQWLEKERKRDEVIDKLAAKLEEDFDEDEIENAKAFVVDYLTNSGIFSQFGEGIDSESLEKISGDYGIEPADGIYILDMLEEIFSAEKEQGSEPKD